MNASRLQKKLNHVQLTAQLRSDLAGSHADDLKLQVNKISFFV